MEQSKSATIQKYFSSIKDPRILKKTKHKLIDIITITICAAICGADDWVSVSNFGTAKHDWLKNFLELPNGIPSHDTFGNVFAVLSIEELEKCFLSWVKAVFKVTDKQVIPIDGKTIRRSVDKSNNKAAIHMVSAWASKSGVTLGQVKTEEKSNEITAIPELLELLEIKGCIVTIDAMGCQKYIATKIINKGADYVLALKGNHSTLHDNVELFFNDALKNNFKDINFRYHETIDGDHGRIEVRKYYMISGIDWLQGKENWKALNSIGMVISERDTGDKVSIENRYYITSLKGEIKEFANAVREHWGIENKVHWVLDIAFREDECRIRKGNSAANFSIIRHIALNLLRDEKTAKIGIKNKRLKSGWDNNYLLKVLKC